MFVKDEVAIANERLWDREVEKGCGYTFPWLELDPEEIRRCADGEWTEVSREVKVISPLNLLADVDGKEVLCLACGGGQQSAVLALLGAQVTVVDLSKGQLAGDRKAASHYGYDVTTVHADMRDLSMLSADSFDLVYGTSVVYVPDIHQVYKEVARVLKTGGSYRSDWGQPATHFVQWDGKNYTIPRPYSDHVEYRDDGGREFRHYMDDIFKGLLELGFTIRQVKDLSRHRTADPEAKPGAWNHQSDYVGGRFVVVARKLGLPEGAGNSVSHQ